jgi:hypothetical protein
VPFLDLSAWQTSAGPRLDKEYDIQIYEVRNEAGEKFGEPGRTRTSNPLFASRNAKYSMFQAVSWFREWQKWAVLGVVVTSVVTKKNLNL